MQQTVEPENGRRDTSPRLLTLSMLASGTIAAGFLNGCMNSARDDFIQVRQAQLIAQPGDRSVYSADSPYPKVVRFSDRPDALSAVAGTRDWP